MRFKLIMIIRVFRSPDSDDSGQEVKSSGGRVKPVFRRLRHYLQEDVVDRKLLQRVAVVLQQEASLTFKGGPCCSASNWVF